MNLTERERIILRLSKEGLSDYKIARKINTDPPSVTRSRKNAHKKLLDALIDLKYAAQMGLQINFPELSSNQFIPKYDFFI